MLQVSKYGKQQNGAGIRPQWSPQVFVKAVATNCGSTLKEWAVTLHSHGNIEHGVQTFLGGLNLNKLEIDFQILCGLSKETGRARVWMRREHSTSSWQVPDSMRRWEAAELPCLACLGVIQGLHVYESFLFAFATASCRKVFISNAKFRGSSRMLWMFHGSV